MSSDNLAAEVTLYNEPLTTPWFCDILQPCSATSSVLQLASTGKEPMGKPRKRYYAVAKGHKPGIYLEWYGEDGAEAQVREFPGARYKGFSSRADAEEWLNQFRDTPANSTSPATRTRPPIPRQRQHTEVAPRLPEVSIYADGASINNPGPGGYGTVIRIGKRRKELWGGARRTTNNRMELMACIVGLQHLKKRSSVTIYSDSRYVVNGINKGWAAKWRAHGWTRGNKQKAENADLWSQLLDLCDAHDIRFVWVKGHADNVENERCDQLATQAARGRNLPPDIAYERGATHLGKEPLFDC